MAWILIAPSPNPAARDAAASCCAWTAPSTSEADIRWRNQFGMEGVDAYRDHWWERERGRWVVRHVRSAGHVILIVDVMHDWRPHGECDMAGLLDPGLCLEVACGADVLIHAPISFPAMVPAREWGEP